MVADGAAEGETFASALVADAGGVAGANFLSMSGATGAAAFVAVDGLCAGSVAVLVLTVFATVADGAVFPLVLAAVCPAAESVLLVFPVLLAGAVAAVVTLFASVTAR